MKRALAEVRWIGTSLDDLRKFPSDVQRGFGYALFFAQEGKQHADARIMKGFGDASVVEIRENDPSGTYRAVYTVRFAGTIYVLHAFQKKSRKGIATNQRDLEAIRRRLKVAKADYEGQEEAMKKSSPRGSKNESRITIGSGNVFADLGLPNAEEEAVRASLVLHLATELEARGLTQSEAAKLLGVDQPTVSRIMRGRFERFSLERIIRVLVSAGRDVKIVIPPARRPRGKSGRLLIEAA